MKKMHIIKAIVLLVFATFIFILHKTGDITRFVNPAYLHFSQIASVLFIVLFFIQVPRIFESEKESHDHAFCGPWGCSHDGADLSFKTFLSYTLICLPLISGLLFPLKDLGAAEALKRGITYSDQEQCTIEDEDQKASFDSRKINELLQAPVLEFDDQNFSTYFSAIGAYPDLFIGKEIKIEGFITNDSLEAHTILTRFFVTHCVADAHAVGIIIEDGVSLGIERDTWVHLIGVLDVREEAKGESLILKVSKWEAISPPKTPYIYPK
ncbi:TIGR03943 family putative permease subunit [Litchfieldia salsa]|uniref:Putative membrane protein n=1 Tax=Litchfieldia salsa TaxID=930152 RepID=A0A1H0WY02_9BACI|nr:TIGR03943 family protein [Litchfieldia salsa]SDP95305.1 putative membrane protein [Litchfieldia salsa]